MFPAIGSSVGSNTIEKLLVCLCYEQPLTNKRLIVHEYVSRHYQRHCTLFERQISIVAVLRVCLLHTKVTAEQKGRMETM